MDFEAKVISREVSELLWEMEKTVSTAESCTGGRIAEAIISVPGASKYFKGGIISYVDEIKESLLGVDHQVLVEQTAVCEEVARQMVIGACKALNTFDLSGCEIFTSCEPCPMCFGAIYWAHLDKIYMGNDRKDAAKIGFDDDFIYQEIALTPEKREKPSEILLRDEALEAFRMWEEKEDKTEY